MSRTVVDRGEALAQNQASPAPTNVKVFKFVKNQSPDEPVEIPGKVLTFHRPVKNGDRERGWKESFSTYETKDEVEAGLIRKTASMKPSLYVFEV